MSEIVSVDPVALASKAWEMVDKRFSGKDWPAPVLDTSWGYICSLSERSNGDQESDRAEIEASARALNDAFREWAGIKRPLVTRVLRDKFEIACRKWKISHECNHKYFTSQMFV